MSILQIREKEFNGISSWWYDFIQSAKMDSFKNLVMKYLANKRLPQLTKDLLSFNFNH